MIYIIPREHLHLADELIAEMRNKKCSLSTSLELAEAIIRQDYPCRPESSLIAGQRYGRLELCHNCYAWRNGKQVPNSTEVYFFPYQFNGKELQSFSAWGGYYFKKIKPGMILFER